MTDVFLIQKKKRANKCNAFNNLITSPGFRSYDENVYLRGFISVWNLDVCPFSTVPFLVMWALKRASCFLTCIFNSIFSVNLMLTLPHGGTLKLHSRIFNDTSGHF